MARRETGADANDMVAILNFERPVRRPSYKEKSDRADSNPRHKQKSTGNMFKDISEVVVTSTPDTDSVLADHAAKLSLASVRSSSAYASRQSSVADHHSPQNPVQPWVQQQQQHSHNSFTSSHNSSFLSSSSNGDENSINLRRSNSLHSTTWSNSSTAEEIAYYRSLPYEQQQYMAPLHIAAAAAASPPAEDHIHSSALRYGIIRCERNPDARWKSSKRSGTWKEFVLVAINGLLFLYPLKGGGGELLQSVRKIGSTSGPFLYYNKKGKRPDLDESMRQFAVDTFSNTPIAILTLPEGSGVGVSENASHENVLQITGTSVRKNLFGAEKKEENVTWLVEVDSAQSQLKWLQFIATLL
ncbi:hypothetical protein BJ741DRAFT_603514 [Chytriomyces cf. hyalinus JEL632]|nr:hypothetical protein BJ741DRAFT_603514 [Chytriomyces cf. hyalinus JEL632]